MHIMLFEKFFSFTFVCTFVQADLKLKFVNVLWRHGARSPLHLFPNDPYNDTWTQGLGQLTEYGMKQQYRLGLFLKERYGNLLNSTYNSSEIYIRSTDVDRTLMSAQCNLLGLYSQNHSKEWDPSNWLPMPVHTVPKDEDQLLRLLPKNNMEYSKILARVWKLPHLLELESKYKEFIIEIKNLTGYVDNLYLKNISNVHDALICEKAQNLTMPKWLTKHRWETLKNISGITMGAVFGAHNSYRIPIAKLRSGTLVEQIIENMKKNINQTQSYKLIGYSAHDTTLAGLLSALDAYDMTLPTFASSIMFELYEKPSIDETQYIVKVFYRSGTCLLNTAGNQSAERPGLHHEPDRFKQLQILGCDLNCPLSDLEKRAEALQYSKEKNASSSSDNINDIKRKLILTTRSLYAVTILLVSTLFIVIAIAIRRCLFEKSDARQPVYEPLNTYEGGL